MKLLLCGLLLIGCGGASESELPPWSPGLPSASEAIGVRRGLTPVRGIIHLHSPYSHDACDGNPRPTGAIDEECLADLRRALCQTRQDFAALTDHDDSMADESWETLFSARSTDDLLTSGADTIASRMTCEDGHEVLIYVGGENGLMPLMLDRHPEGTVADRHDFYNAEDVGASQTFREHGGIAWINHAEQHDLGWIRDRQPDGLEIYQLHANIDPNIRVDYLGLDAAGAITAVADFADPQYDAEPDLALLSFLTPNQPALDHWDALLGEGMRLAGSGGTDAHQNSVPLALSDGERGDSYRRMIRWFSNVALATDPRDPVAVEAAVRAGRFFVSMDIFGVPAGFDVVATGSSGTAELGDELLVTDAATLEVAVPSVYGLDPTLPAPEITARILRIDAGGATEVARGTAGTVTAPLSAPGAYRVQVSIVPHHLAPYLGKLESRGYATREQVWIYANPIYVR